MEQAKINAVIVEDEEESLHLLINLVIASGLAVISGFTSDPGEATDLILKEKPDIVFLDIKMPGKNGFEILDDLRKIPDADPYIVFTTAYNDYAVKAFEYAAFDYLLKPVEPSRLAETISRCINAKKSGVRQHADMLLHAYKKLMFRNNSGILFIDPAEVVYIEAEGNYSVFHLINGRTETVTMLLGKVDEQLEIQNFFRINRSYIINLDYLKKINTRQLQCILMNNGFEFRCNISRDKIGELVIRMRRS